MSAFGVVSLLMLIIHASCLLVYCGDVPDPDDSDFDPLSYCKLACQWGRGGNLCNCHAAYFAGKRLSSSVGSDRGQVRGAPASSTGIDRPSTVDNNDMWTALTAERHPLTKLPPGTAKHDGNSETAEDDVEQRWWTATEELRRHLRSATSNSVSRWRP